MKKLKWTGTETEFLEFMMFIDTILYEISERFENFSYPTILQSSAFMERFIEVNYKTFDNFFELKMQGRPVGILFHRLLRLKRFIEQKHFGPKKT